MKFFDKDKFYKTINMWIVNEGAYLLEIAATHNYVMASFKNRRKGLPNTIYLYRNYVDYRTAEYPAGDK